MNILNFFNTTKLIIAASVVVSLSLVSCGEEEKTTSSEQTCFYSHSESTETLVHWTAFKTTARVPVSGQFNQVNVSTEGKSTKVVEVLRTIKFNIPTSSTNSANPERDAKIVNSFFGSMDLTDLIIGHVKNAEGDNKSGFCVFYLSLNNVEREVKFTYTIEDALIQLNGKIDLFAFQGESAIGALNAVCEDLHKGEDGVSKTWPEVEVTIETTLNKKCH